MEENRIMTSQEISAELGIKETYLKKRWTYIVESNAKRGVYLVKIGRGESANYGIKSYGDEDIRFSPKEEV